LPLGHAVTDVVNKATDGVDEAASAIPRRGREAARGERLRLFRQGTEHQGADGEADTEPQDALHRVPPALRACRRRSLSSSRTSRSSSACRRFAAALRTPLENAATLTSGLGAAALTIVDRVATLAVTVCAFAVIVSW